MDQTSSRALSINHDKYIYKIAHKKSENSEWERDTQIEFTPYSWTIVTWTLPEQTSVLITVCLVSITH